MSEENQFDLENPYPKSYFSINFNFNSQCDGIRVRIEIVGYEKTTFLERSRLIEDWIEKTVTSIPDSYLMPKKTPPDELA